MISIVIPSYKNKEMFIKNMQHNWPYLKDHEVIVVNDDPSEPLTNILKDFPTIHLIENEHNLGFGGTVNRGFEHATKSLVLLLNSDVLLNNDDFQKLTHRFAEESALFAISFAQKNNDGKIGGKNAIHWQRGLFLHSGLPSAESGINGWAEGGSAMFDREKVVKIGGFDTLYKPFYWEDIDLSYRAWKMGYTVEFDAQVKVEHHHESTIGKYFKKDTTQIIAFRNQFICIWKNITDNKLLLNHLLWLGYNLVYYAAKGEFKFHTGFVKALLLLPKIMRQRKIVTHQFTVKDAIIFQKFL